MRMLTAARDALILYATLAVFPITIVWAFYLPVLIDLLTEWIGP